MIRGSSTTTALVMIKRGHRRGPLTRPAADLSPRGEVKKAASSRLLVRRQLVIAVAPAGRGLG